MSDYATILTSVDDGVATITINRPKALNALNSTILAELTEAFAAYEADKSQLCAVLTGSGDKAFAAGADIKEMSEKAAADFYLEDFFSPWTSEIVKKTRKPWIAAVNGFALGDVSQPLLVWYAPAPEISKTNVSVPPAGQ